MFGIAVRRSLEPRRGKPPYPAANPAVVPAAPYYEIDRLHERGGMKTLSQRPMINLIGLTYFSAAAVSLFV
jgi:hypothetical protein